MIAMAQLLCLCISAQHPLQLVKNGKSPYQIVKAEGNNEARAAGLLQEYVQKITGCTLPIVSDNAAPKAEEIIIGQTKRVPESDWKKLCTELQTDGFSLQTNQKKLIIAGGSGKGVIYGVTTLLENYMGCKKLSPEVEVVPTAKSISIPSLSIRQVPPAVIRIINSPLAADSNYKDWQKLATVADFWNDGDWRGYYVHTFNRLVPVQQYFDTHPEYYAMINGKRSPHGQLCLTNPDVLKITIDQLRKDIEAHPNVQYWSVSQNDNYDNCQCENCKKLDDADGSPMGSLLQFVNKVAATFPNKTITTLAYQYSRKPPLHTKPLPNVMITLCTIELNRSKPIETDSSSISFKNDIVGWGKICRNIMLWDYEIQFTNYLCPFPLFHTLQPNIQFFTKHGVQAHFQQNNGVHGAEFAELKTYLIAKLLWNPDVNADSVINDFMKGYYQEAAPYVKAYFDLLHSEAKRSGQGLDIYGTPVWNAKTFLSDSLIQQYYSLFDKAEAAVKSKPEVLERVKVSRLPVQFADMEIAKTDMFGPRGWYAIQQGKYVLKPERSKLLEDFYATCKRNKVIQLNEMGLTADIYYSNTKRFIDVQVEGNLAFQKPVTCKPMPNEKYTGSGTGMLTNAVRGTDDYKINWLGWQAQDVEIVVDLENVTAVKEITLSSLQFPKSWIIHPSQVSCAISSDGVGYTNVGTVASNTDLQQEPMMKNFTFKIADAKARYIKLNAVATKTLPAWHSYFGNPAWLFIDEVVVH